MWSTSVVSVIWLNWRVYRTSRFERSIKRMCLHHFFQQSIRIRCYKATSPVTNNGGKLHPCRSFCRLPPCILVHFLISSLLLEAILSVSLLLLRHKSSIFIILGFRTVTSVKLFAQCVGVCKDACVFSSKFQRHPQMQSSFNCHLFFSFLPFTFSVKESRFYFCCFCFSFHCCCFALAFSLSLFGPK